MALNSNAVIEVDEYKVFSVKNKDSEDLPTDQYEFLINAASTFLSVDDLNRIVVPTTNVTEIFFGNGSDTYYPDNMRINSVASISEWQSTQFVELAVGTYPYTNDTTKFYFTEGRTFAKSLRYQLIYNTGWARSAVPGPIKLVACQVVQRLIKAADGREGMTAESFGDATTTFDLAQAYTDKMSRSVAKYRVVAV